MDDGPESTVGPMIPSSPLAYLTRHTHFVLDFRTDRLPTRRTRICLRKAISPVYSGQQRLYPRGQRNPIHDMIVRVDHINETP